MSDNEEFPSLSSSIRQSNKFSSKRISSRKSTNATTVEPIQLPAFESLASGASSASLAETTSPDTSSQPSDNEHFGSFDQPPAFQRTPGLILNDDDVDTNLTPYDFMTYLSLAIRAFYISTVNTSNYDAHHHARQFRRHIFAAINSFTTYLEASPFDSHTLMLSPVHSIATFGTSFPPALSHVLTSIQCELFFKQLWDQNERPPPSA